MGVAGYTTFIDRDIQRWVRVVRDTDTTLKN
jgi:hypothetical protein